MTGPTPPWIFDAYHGDNIPDMRALKNAGCVGAIFKAGQGQNEDPAYQDFYQRAITVWPSSCVHSYWFLDGEDPHEQMQAFVNATKGRGCGRWLDWEENPSSQAPLDVATKCAQVLQTWQTAWPGIYGSDKDLLGSALDAGHFDACPLWIARYSEKPSHDCELWQFAEGVEGDPVIDGMKLDLSTYLGSGDCAAFMAAVSAGAWKR